MAGACRLAREVLEAALGPSWAAAVGPCGGPTRAQGCCTRMPGHKGSVGLTKITLSTHPSALQLRMGHSAAQAFLAAFSGLALRHQERG